MSFPFVNWPYAVRPVIQFEWHATTLTLFLVFRFPMDIDVTPPVNLFVVKVDGVNKTPNNLVWGDAYTLRVNLFAIAAHPDRVLCTYNGPDDGLRMQWQKQWEPFDRIVCGDVPFDWEHILDVDVPNARVTINGVLALSTLTLTAGLNQSPDVSGVNIIFINCTAGDVSIKSFVNGINGQILHVAKVTDCANDVTVIHKDAPPGQNINLHVGGDETLTSEYGGWTFVCDSYNWFDVSHAKHV